MKKILFFCMFLFLCLKAENLSIFVASSASKTMSAIKDEFLKTHPNDNIEMIFGASGKYYQLLKQGRKFDLFFSADEKYAEAIFKDQNALEKPKIYALGVLALYSLDPNLIHLKNLKENLTKINHLSIANPKIAPYGVAAKEILEKLDLGESLKNKIILGDNIAQPVLYVDSKASNLGIVAYSLVSPINRPKGYASIIDPKYFTPLKQSFVITKYAKNKKLAFEFSDFIGSTKAKEIFKKYGFDTP
ncbi:molybdate ABC transporter substrate-binding protein [Campylobacter sp. W0014]|uniref:molybdate ABC transporter substrate-binding protein n=1 Tax=Campylobacter sp. W0014 TaxID=2735781 RepID=UPI001EC1E6E6|nr:molybdate ABC transporter substrate-binding protein [Campylobacter sp. W0014]